MRARTAALASVLTLCATLYGCSNSVHRSDTIKGAGTAPGPAETAVATASPSASLAPVAGLSMSFHIPADLTLRFEPTDQGSAAANRIETILVYQYESFIEALSSGETRESDYRSLTGGDALGAENTELDWWKQRDERLTGVDRLYDFSVSMPDSHSAVYSFCEDSTRLEYLNLSNGQTIQNTASTRNNHTLRQGTLVQGKGELWAVDKLITQDGAAACVGK